MFVCSDIEPFAVEISAKFESKCLKVFKKPHDVLVPTALDEVAKLRAGLSEDGKLRPRCWLLDKAK